MKYFILIIMFLGLTQVNAQPKSGLENNGSQCPQLQIAISSTVLKMNNNDNYYTVSYCNHGGLAAENTSIEFDLDSKLTILNSTIPIAAQKNSTYKFDLGNIDKETCNSFSIQVAVNATAVANQSHCVEARVYHDACVSTGTNDNGTTTQAVTLGRAELSTANGPTGAPNSVFEDNVMLNQGPLTFDSLEAIAGYLEVDVNQVIANIEDIQISNALAIVNSVSSNAILVSNHCGYNMGSFSPIAIGAPQKVLGTDKIVTNELIKVYPNPMESYTIFETTEKEYNTLTLQLTDLAGRVLQQITVAHQQKIELQKADLSAGIYFYQLKGDKAVLGNGKLIIK